MGYKYVKGQSGNPSGRPKQDPQIKAMFLGLIPEALAAVKACLKSEDEGIRLKAADVVFERSLGKAAQAVEVTGDISIKVNLFKK